MTQPKGWSARRAAVLDRVTARLTASLRAPAPIVLQPEPRAIGLHARGRKMLRGQFLLAGFFVDAPDTLPWDIRAPHPAFAVELHGFGWLDHLAAVGDAAARSTAQHWLTAWLQRHGRGSGPGWTADLAGRRLLRWIAHALLLTSGPDARDTRAFQRSLRHHALFLERRWPSAAPGLPQFEALTGLLQAGVALQGMERLTATARTAIARACRAQIGPDGGIATRNPEELLEILTLLTWGAAILSDAAQRCDPEHAAAIERIAVTLRTLRHADGGLARFHGGGRGMEGRLDHALAASNTRDAARDGRAMGYARLAGGRTSVVVDAAAPPPGPASRMAHASTLAFELTSHRRPLIVSCGAGAPFGPDWERAARATASHSTLSIDGYSSSRMGTRTHRPELVDGPRSVDCLREVESYGTGLRMSHDGYSDSHGLVHLRRLDLSADGRALMGEDSLVATSPAERRRVDRLRARAGGKGIAYAVRFHLHPEADASVDMNGTAISVGLRSGEVWVFRAEGAAQIALEPSVYLEKGRRKPRPSRQIVLSARVERYTSAITWTLAKAQDTPVALRDIGRDDVLALPDI